VQGVLLVRLKKKRQTTFVASSVKLCLFYDWMFFNPAADSIMNIGKYVLSCICFLIKNGNVDQNRLCS